MGVEPNINDLTIENIIARTSSLVYLNSRRLFVSLTPLFILYFLVGFSFDRFLPDLSVYFKYIPSIIIQAQIALTTHRVLLLEATDGAQSFNLLFTLYFIAMSLTFVAISYLPSAGVLVLFPIALWIVSRCSMIFPALAIGQEMTLDDSWALTENQKRVVFMGLILFPLLGSLVFALPTVLFPWFKFLLSSIFTVACVAALSLIYRHISLREQTNE